MKRILFILTILLPLACSRHGAVPQTGSRDGSVMIRMAQLSGNDERTLFLADSLEKTGDITSLEADNYRGLAYGNQPGNTRQSEYYYRRAYNATPRTDEDMVQHVTAGVALSEAMIVRGNYEEALRVSRDVMELVENGAQISESQLAWLQCIMGLCLIQLDQLEEGENQLLKSYYLSVKIVDEDIETTFGGDVFLSNLVVHCYDVAEKYIAKGLPEKAEIWIRRMDKAYEAYLRRPTRVAATRAFLEGLYFHLHSRYCAAIGQTEQARKYLQSFTLTDLYPLTQGKIMAADALFAAGRWSEAADHYEYLDEYKETAAIAGTLDFVKEALLPKYLSNAYAGRTATALKTGREICTALDTAILAARRNKIEELATLFQTHEKEKTIAQQKSTMRNERLLAIVIAFAIIIAAMAIFLINRARTDRRLKQKNEELTLAYARAEESARMKSFFIQQISHEVRSPLNVLSGFTQLITTPGVELGEDEKAEINKGIVENTERITGLVNKMLELSDTAAKTDIPRPDTIPVKKLAEEAILESGIRRARHVTFTLQADDALARTTLTTNLIQATRALALLLDNAQKFTRPAEAAVKAGAKAKPATVKLLIRPQGSHIAYTVEDTGIGVPAADAERIFQEFVQLDDYYDGTGIGLTVARGIARRLGGDIVLDTSYTKGARFVFTLPAQA